MKKWTLLLAVFAVSCGVTQQAEPQGTQEVERAATLPVIVHDPEPIRIDVFTTEVSLQQWSDRCVLTVELGDHMRVHPHVDASVCADERVWRFAAGQ